MFRRIFFRQRIPILISMGAVTTGLVLQHKTIHCSPTFQGVPVAGTFLIHQSIPYFDKKFPGLEIAGAFVPDEIGHSYKESKVLGLYATACTVTIPVYQKLSKQEEERLGKAMLKKIPVGHLVLEGDCKVGCAAATLTTIKLYKLDADQNPDLESLVWEWNRS
jgi:hypothetical protein